MLVERLSTLISPERTGKFTNFYSRLSLAKEGRDFCIARLYLGNPFSSNSFAKSFIYSFSLSIKGISLPDQLMPSKGITIAAFLKVSTEAFFRIEQHRNLLDLHSLEKSLHR